MAAVCERGFGDSTCDPCGPALGGNLVPWQQAAEKVLKALWLEHKGLEPPRIHDLVRLAEEAGLPSGWFEEIDALSRVYLVSRYPGAVNEDEPPYGIDASAAERHLALAERMAEWVEQQLSTESSSD